MDEQAVAERTERAVGAHDGFGRRPLHEGARLVVEARAEEVVRRRVADLEVDRRIELHELDEIVRGERAGLGGRRRGQRFGAKLLDRPHRFDA